MDFIWDKDGKQLAWIDRGKVFDANTHEAVGILLDGKIFTPNGSYVCDLAGLDAPGDTPEEFTKILKTK